MTTTRIERHLRAPRARVYAALLDARAVQQWMVPDDMSSEVLTFDAREGGMFHITLRYDAPTTAGKTDARSDTSHGRFVRLVPDTEIVQVVAFVTDDPTLTGESTIRYVLTPPG